MIKAIIFDFDDTLCMTAKSNHTIISEAVRSFDATPLTYKEHKKTVGDPLKVIVANYFPQINVDEFISRVNKIRTGYLSSNLIETIPQENLDSIDKLALQGKQLIVLTSRRAKAIENLMDPMHHLGSRIAHFYHLDNNPYHKPDPRSFEVIEKQHGIKSDECVYVGDTLHDAAASTGAGLHFIASLESGILTKEDFADYKVDAFIKKFPEVVAAIDRLEKESAARGKKHGYGALTSKFN